MSAVRKLRRRHVLGPTRYFETHGARDPAEVKVKVKVKVRAFKREHLSAPQKNVKSFKRDKRDEKTL